MDRTITIVRYQWRAYWRHLRQGGRTTAGNQGIALLIFGLVFVRYLQWLRIASINLPRGKSALFEALLAAIFLAWMFPLTDGGRGSLATRRWLHLPLSLKELFRVRVISVLMPPSSWLVIAGSLAICYPLVHIKRPFVGIVAALLFIAMSGFTGLTVSHLISVALWRRVLAAGAVSLAGAIGLYVMSGREVLRLSRFLPSTLVVRAAIGQRSWLAIVILATLCAGAYYAALWSFRQSLENTASRSSDRSRTFVWFKLPGKLGGLVAKDLRYFRRLLDAYLGLLAAAAGCFYLVTAAAVSQGIFLAFIVLVFLLNAALPFNSFGLDTRAGLGRYTLFPLSGKSIILSKNLAYLGVLGVQVFPMIILAGWRLGIPVSAIGLVEAASLGCAYLTWGNWMSVSHPLKMHFFRFASSGAALADALAGVAFGSLPGVLMIYLLHAQGNRPAGPIALVALLFGALYWASLVRFGRRFEQKREAIGRALS